MIEQWRDLLYPLGFISSLAFTGRFLVQWIYSEIRQQSVVTQLFWKLSLTGNVFLLMHSIIQGQFHVAFIQTCNGVISWRNLNLMRAPVQQRSLNATLLLWGMALSGLLSVFFLQAKDLEGWFRIPVWLWQESHTDISMAWHLIGFGGLIFFNSRFWIQWWLAEKQKKSFLGPSFWWMSLIGDLFCLAYFFKIWDPVNIVGPAFGLIPYVRNLMLTYKPSKISKSTS